MKLVNLLPEWYLEQRRQARSIRFRFALIVALGGAMIIWNLLAEGRIALHAHVRDELTRRAAMVGNLGQDIRKTDAELRRLKNLQLAYRELGSTVPISALVQQVQNDMTRGMALSRVSIDVRPEPVKGSGFVGDIKNPPRYHEVAHMTVVGVAPNDVQIAQLIGKISGNPLFADVSLNYTRTETLRESAVRRFEIQMTMDLHRLPPEEPADPAPAVAASGDFAHAR
jgi:hypothetical protein